MDLVKILNTKAIRILQNVESPGVFLPDLSKFVAERYKFVHYPTTAEEYSADHIEFRFGTFSNRIISKLQIYRSGLYVEANTSTDELDKFLDDIITALETVGSTASRDGVQKLYGSTLEIKMSSQFSTWFRQLDPVVASVKSAIAQSGVAVASYEVSGFTISGEGPEAFKPPRFVLERRVEQPFEANLFFSEGPLSTMQHLGVLEQIESLF